MHACRFESFVQRELGQNRGEPASDHGFPGSGRSDHEHIVPSDRGDFQGAFYGRLSAHIAEIADIFAGFGEAVIL